MEKKVKEGVKGMEVREGGEMERGRRGKGAAWMYACITPLSLHFA